MARDSLVYGIPNAITKTFLDMEIAIQNDDGLGMKPKPVKVLLAWLVSIMLLLLIITKTFVGSGGIVWTVIFALTWAWLTYMLFSYTNTKQFKASRFLSLPNYLPKSQRYMNLRTTGGDMESFRRLVGIESVDEESGVVSFTDGTWGLVCSVVGSASILLFEDDRRAILDRVQMFWNKVPTTCEYIFVTKKEPQKVYRQIGHLQRRYDSLSIEDRELRSIMNRQFDTLKNHVGTSFKSVHQYCIVKGDNVDALNLGLNVLVSEVESSSLMMRNAEALKGEDLMNFFASFYRGDMQARMPRLSRRKRQQARQKKAAA